MKVLKRVVGITRWECMRTEAIRERLKQEAVVAQVKRRRKACSDKVMENEGSEQGNEWTCCRKKTQREAQKRWKGDSRIVPLSYIAYEKSTGVVHYSKSEEIH